MTINPGYKLQITLKGGHFNTKSTSDQEKIENLVVLARPHWIPRNQHLRKFGSFGCLWTINSKVGKQGKERKIQFDLPLVAFLRNYHFLIDQCLEMVQYIMWSIWIAFLFGLSQNALYLKWNQMMLSLIRQVLVTASSILICTYFILGIVAE